MAGFNLNILEQALADTRGSGVSFESQAKKWENEEQGECVAKFNRIRFGLHFKGKSRVKRGSNLSIVQFQ